MKKILLSVLLVFWNLLIHSQRTAVYSVSFTSNWNTLNHSDNGTIPLPSNPHWSNLVGATHNDQTSFFKEGISASMGIEDMAETGANTELKSEVTTAIENNFADQWLQKGFSPNGTSGIATIDEIIVDEDYPLLTLVSMIAPSPDWFVGIDSFSFINESNEWVPTTIINLYIYDAGTEDGFTYATDNLETTPREIITSMINVAPFNSQKIGTLTLAFLSSSTLNLENSDFENVVQLYPNPVKNIIHIKSHNSEVISKVELFDIFGKKIRQQTNPLFLDVTNLNNGIYIAKITSLNNKEFIRKVIKK